MPRRFLVCLGWAALIAAFAPMSTRSAPRGDSRDRITSLVVPTGGAPGFRRIAPSSVSIQFTNVLSMERALRNRTLLNGSGIAAGDVDGDGWCDLYFCGLDAPNALYRNLGGWRFEDVTQSAGVACDGQASTGAVFADVDGDADLDLLVTAIDRGVRLFLNNGQGRFTEATGESGLLPTPAGTTMTLADIDGDADLDLYVVHYRPDTIADKPHTTYQVQVIDGWPTVVQVNGQPVTAPQWTNRFEVSPLGRVLELGLADCLYLNDGRGRFTPAPFTGGHFMDETGNPLSQPPFDWGLAALFCDVNGDNAPDLYVCNDFQSPDRIWINDGTGRFRALARHAMRTISAFSMGVDVADINRDGHPDIFVVDMLSPDHRKRHVQLGERASTQQPPGLEYDRLQVSRNTLQLNRGDGTFAEVGHFAGVEASDWSWQPTFLDVDLDGFEDILISNGMLRDFQNSDLAESMEALQSRRRLGQQDILEWIRRIPALETPNVAFRNRGDGTFESVGSAWGFADSDISQGMALADLDNDGDMDVVVNNMNAAPGIYRNESSAPRLAVRLHGSGANTAGTGARIVVRGGPVVQTQQMIAGGRYLSGDHAQRVFAAGSPTQSLTVEVTWRSGTHSTVQARANTLIEISEATARQSEPATVTVSSPALFEPFPGFPQVTHSESSFDDFARQPLLSRALDRLGPGVSWHDLNRDGWEDLIIGNGRGALPIVLINQKGKGFARETNAPFNRPLGRDQTSVIGVRDTLLAGSSNYEDGSTNGGLIRLYDLGRRISGESLTGFPFACGPVAMADVDGDGDLDLFIGGRAQPGRYPQPADSILFRNDSGRFTPWQRWEGLGLTSGATFSDLNGDGFPELILAIDGGPVRVFQREGGKYHDRTEAWGMARFTGYWNGVATGDLNGDGRPDLIASNWGLNTRRRASPTHPWRVHYGDIDDNGTFDIIESRFDPAMGRDVPQITFNWVRDALPFIRTRMADYSSYANTGMDEIFGEALAQARTLEVNTLASMMFLNRGDHFEAVALPAPAQFAPAFGISIGDFDANGTEDVFLAQNAADLPPREDPADAGLGLILLNDGQAGLRPLSPVESGIRILGQQRGCALGDADGDGRVDLVVGQNGDNVLLFRNRCEQSGLRIRLRGPAGNPDGVGARIRLERNGQAGPVREIKAGSGYWSQDAAVQIMALPDERVPDSVRVQWPGGGETKAAVSRGATEVTISFEPGADTRP